MRTAGMPNFRKLYGRVNTDIEPGMYQVVIQNNYNVEDFTGIKKFVLSTSNATGGTNYFLSWCYIITGALCIVFALAFSIMWARKFKLT
jgi:hypothetical protein